jgi:molecular chaperone GrpE
MSTDGPKSNNAADDAIREALESVERLEQEVAGEAANDDDISLDEVELVRASSEGQGDDEDEVAIVDEPAPKKPSVQDAILQSMIEAKNEAVAVLEQTQKEATSLRERLMRVSAEFENYKKRQSREKQDAIKFANERLLKELLPVADNFELALGSAKQTEQLDEAGINNLVQGIEMVHKQFAEALKKNGVEAFSALGERFDPSKHEAISTKEDASVPNQTVLEEYQRGYMLQGRLVRPAMVIVSSGGPPAAKADAPSGDEAKASGDGE